MKNRPSGQNVFHEGEGRAGIYPGCDESAGILAGKAVFEREGEESIVAAQRPVHPLGKCFAGPGCWHTFSLPSMRMVYLCIATETILKRYGADVSDPTWPLANPIQC